MFGGVYFGAAFPGGNPFVSSGSNATFSTVAGGESAAGGSTSFTGDASFSTTVSADNASGGSTSFSVDATFTTTVSADTADGGSTSLTGGGTFTTTVSGDTGSGGSTTLTGDGSFSTTASGDTAAGGSTTFDTGSNANFDTTTPGGESAAGGSTSFTGTATFTTLVSGDTAAGGSTTLTGDGGFSTVASGDTASGGSSTFTGSGGGTVNANFGGGVTTLKYPRPAWLDTATVRNVPVGGETYTFPSNTTDYLLVFPNAPVTGALQYTGGRNVGIVGGWMGGHKTQPALASSYDATNRGIRFYDGADVRTIWIEGLYVEGTDDGYSPTYHSDTIQIAQRSTNGVTVYIQNVRVAGINWGNNVTTPNVHADVVQCWGGPTNMFVDGLTAKHLTYQGFYWNPADGRSLPTGTHQRWEVSRVNLEGDNLTGNGVRYLLYNVQPTFMNPLCSDVYTYGSSRNVTDGTGKWPSTGLTQNAKPPGGDFVPFTLWDPATFSYLGDSVGVSGSVATASGGTGSFTVNPVSVFATNVGTASATGDLSTFTGSVSGGTATFSTLAGVAIASGAPTTFDAITPQDGTMFGTSAPAVASGGETVMFGLATTGTFWFTPPVLVNRPLTASDIGYTVIKNGAAYRIKMSPANVDTVGADFVYVGGHVYEISPDERNALVSAGYSVSSTPL